MYISQRDKAIIEEEIGRQSARFWQGLEACWTAVDEIERDRNIASYLETVSSEARVFSGIFRELYKRSSIQIEDIQDLEVHCNLQSDQKKKFKQSMLEISRANWQSQKPEMVDGVVSGLEDRIDDTQTDFTLLTKSGQLIGFVGYTPDKKDPNKLVSHSGNIAKDYRGSKLGEALILQDLKAKVEEGKSLIGDVHPSLPIGMKYVEQAGYVIMSVIDNYKDTGEALFVIEADKKSNEGYISKNMTEDDIFGLLNNHSSTRVEHAGVDILIEKFPADNENIRGLGEVEQKLASGYVCTRYLPDRHSKNRVYVFEKRIS